MNEIMIRVLVIGLTDVVGGIETYLKNLVMLSNKDEIVFDFVLKTPNKAAFGNEIIRFYSNNAVFFHVSKLKKNPIKCIKSLISISKSNAYDVIYINTMSSSDILYALLMNTNARIIIHSHCSMKRNALTNRLFKRVALKESDYRIACSEMAAKYMFSTMRNVSIINNGINIDKFKYSREKREYIRNKYSISPNDFVVGSVGRFCYQKNQLFLVKILNEIVLNNKKCNGGRIILMLVGGGPNEELIKDSINKYGINDCVVFPGVVSDPENYYNAFDIFALPSCYEGLPISGIEAQCNGLYCLFSDRMDKRIMITSRSRMIGIAKRDQSKWINAVLSIYKKDLNDDQRITYADVLRDNGFDEVDTCNAVFSIIKDCS